MNEQRERRPWNRLRKTAGMVLVLGLGVLIAGLIDGGNTLRIIAAVLIIAANVLNIVSVPSQRGESDTGDR